MLAEIWLPSQLRGPRRRALVYFVCGNPGCIGFYADFLETLRAMLDSSERLTAYDVYGRNLRGFSDAEHAPFSPARPPWDLDGQIDAVYDDVAGRGGSYDLVVLASHSIGAYMAVEVMHRHRRRLATPGPDGAPPRLALRHGLLLFPTIASLALSPSGRRLALLRRVPGFEARAHAWARLLLGAVSERALRWLLARALGWSPRAAGVGAEWLKSRDGVRQALHMAMSELDQVGEDRWGDELWEAAPAGAQAPTFFLFYGHRDHWVADRVRDEFIRRRRQRGGPSVAVDGDRLPHAFCTSEHGSWVVAKRVHGWIQEIDAAAYGLGFTAAGELPG